MSLDIECIFSHHPPTSDDVARKHAKVRALLKELAFTFEEELPDSAEKTLAIRKLQAAMMYANSAIAQYS